MGPLHIIIFLSLQNPKAFKTENPVCKIMVYKKVISGRH